MSEEGKFWATIWALGAACVISVVAATFAYNVQRDAKVQAMVKSGADPILAACSLGGPRDYLCSVYAVAKPAR
ncbi:hypothetical protein ACTJNK_26025 [Achromobacter anxifer]